MLKYGLIRVRHLKKEGGVFIGKKEFKVVLSSSLIDALNLYSEISGDTKSCIVRKAIRMFLKYKGVIKNENH